MRCFVTGCTSTTLTSGDDKQYQFFRFPPDQRTLLKWKKSLGLPSDLVIPKSARICNRHFVCGVKEASLPTKHYSSAFASVPTRPKPRYRHREHTGESPIPKRPHLTAEEPSLPVVEGASMGQSEIGVQTTKRVSVSTASQASVYQHDMCIQAGEHVIDKQIKKLEKELQDLRLEHAKRECQLLSCILRIESIRNDDSLIRFYTGFPNVS